MLDEPTRTSILRLHREGHGTRVIADVLGVSRGAVKRVLREGQSTVPMLVREELARPYHAQIVELFGTCKGNLVRVHEEISALGADISYQALTAYCRRHGIGHRPPVPVGRYPHAPGQEMQHDTSPHVAKVGGKMRRVQTASLALCFSRMVFAQCYPRFSRFECKVFLTDAFEYYGGTCSRNIIDNTHVVVLSGTGALMVPVPEMASFADRFGFVFVAHEVGDANRSAVVERPFHYIENNFFAGREFADFADLNSQLRAWCDRVNATRRRHLHASPRELFAVDRQAMTPLPIHVPEVYALHHRILDTEGYLNLHQNRYSAPYQLIGRTLEIRESKDRVDVFDGPRLVATHTRVLESAGARVIDPAHRPKRSEGALKRVVPEQEQRISQRMPVATEYIALLRKRGRGSVRDLRWLLRMIDEYPRDAVEPAIRDALAFGLTDLERLERMVLRRIASDYFVLRRQRDDDEEDE